MVAAGTGVAPALCRTEMPTGHLPVDQNGILADLLPLCIRLMDHATKYLPPNRRFAFKTTGLGA